MKEEILPILKGVYYIATCEGDQPHVRPFDGAVILDDVLYIGTNDNKEVYQQILKNPKVEIFAMGEDGMLRFVAEAHVPENVDAKEVHEAMGKDSSREHIAVLRLDSAAGTLTQVDGTKKEVKW